MSYLNYQFFDEYKSLDNLCRDIYGQTIDKKLGVTLYLDDMDSKANQGELTISGWVSDYHHLKRVRNLRNELAHSQNTFCVDICSQEDIDFIRAFKIRILNQTDPIAQLRKQITRPRSSSNLNARPKQRPMPSHTQNIPNHEPTGCLGMVASFLMVALAFVVLLI
jgi:hypothetical protein